jgi:hypothetical protein
LAAVVGCHGVGDTGASSPQDEPEWSGTWNYTQPDIAADRDIGHLSCPDGFALVLPQLGWARFARSDRGLVVETDQGCRWTFARRGRGAALEPPAQTCFNKVIGSSYTLTRWNIAVASTEETETIVGKSHQPGGDCTFTLPAGHRTRVTDSGVDAPARFLGAWSFDATDAPGANLQQAMCPGDAPGVLRPRVATGGVTITQLSSRTIRAVTDDGCPWTLAVAGNTAELDPPQQTCTASQRRRRFWAMASDGQRIATVASGTEMVGDVLCDVVLATGRLVRR